jgi:alanine racemase
MRVGIVTCGYADGYRRAYSNKAQVIVGGKRVAVLGRVAMDYTMIDLTDVADAEVGMEVIMLGSDGDNWISPQALSPYGESVSGEVTCAISRRVPREYVWEGRNDV